MDTFLKTKFTIDPGFGMGMYSLGHILWLLCGLAVLVILGLFYKASDYSRRRRILFVLASLTLLDEIYKFVVPLLTGQWNWEFLPLHICSISIFVVVIHACTMSDKVAEYLYAITLPTAIMALVFPNWVSELPCANYESIHSFSVHWLLVIYTSMLLFGGFRPSFARLRYSAIPFLLLAGVAVIANSQLDTNFFFLNGGDEGNPLSFLEKRIGNFYILAFPVIAAICWVPMYLIPKRMMKAKKY